MEYDVKFYRSLRLFAPLSGKAAGTLAVAYRTPAPRACNARGSVPAAQGNARASVREKATVNTVARER